MLYPQSNPFRQTIDLSGFWDFRFDPDRRGEQARWSEGFAGGRPIAVPASWNDQFEDGRDYLGPAWYQTRFDLPWGWSERRVVTQILGHDGVVHVRLEQAGGIIPTARFTLRGHGTQVSVEALSTREVTLTVPNAAPWTPGSPSLYDLTVELVQGGAACDRYTLPVGIRTVAVDGDALLLNGQPILLKGFGRHEDFPVAGRGLVPAVIVKDYALMKWVGANSFRTTHYPYSEQMMDLADRLGLMVIDETPAVGLFFHEEGLERRLALCRQYTRELIARDKNHPSVIVWSLANEPHSLRPAARPFFRDLYDLARSLDATRPVTVVSCMGLGEEAFEIEVANSKPYVVGQHVWNLCDFKTGQAVHRMGGMNLKGVFTRDRRPKLAAHRLRETWSSQ
jgi:beta-galactosidase/beta-glucuronidase